MKKVLVASLIASLMLSGCFSYSSHRDREPDRREHREKYERRDRDDRNSRWDGPYRR
ncbi:hypothetical protein ANT2_0446 [plant metagenome]|uniref:Lipoprotein n=1 Tax=plant metagenome TaxID=1297885 RepID=A0A484R2X4_9ZZZZ